MEMVRAISMQGRACLMNPRSDVRLPPPDPVLTVHKEAAIRQKK